MWNQIGLCSDQPPKSVNCMGDGELGRNRTFNLLIKSQLLCQLSYAPTANSEVGTNFDCTIRFVRALGRLSPTFAVFELTHA